MKKRLLFFLFLLVASCKNPNEKACREGMVKIGITTEPQQSEMCTKSCSYIEQTYGISKSKCEYMQRGLTGPEPK